MCGRRNTMMSCILQFFSSARELVFNKCSVLPAYGYLVVVSISLFVPFLGEIITFDEYFSTGLKPPNRIHVYIYIYVLSYTISIFVYISAFMVHKRTLPHDLVLKRSPPESAHSCTYKKWPPSFREARLPRECRRQDHWKLCKRDKLSTRIGYLDFSRRKSFSIINFVTLNRGTHF